MENQTQDKKTIQGKNDNILDLTWWADFWRYTVGVNVIPADTRHKTTHIKWTEWQNAPIPLQKHEEWKKNNAFRLGMAVITGKTFHNDSKNGLYLYCIDCDNKKAKDEFFSNWDKISDSTLVEWHDDNPDKVHIYGYTHNPIPKKSSDIRSKVIKQKADCNEFPAFEIKGKGQDGIMFCSPSVHENGEQYHIGLCQEPKITDGIEYKIDEICQKYGIPYLVNSQTNSNRCLSIGDYKIPIDTLIHDDAISILKGHNRHEAILRIAEHYVATIPDVSDEMLYSLTESRNQKVCNPPLESNEMQKLCRQAVNYVEKTIGLPKNDSKKRKDPIQYNIIAQRIIDEHHLITLTKTHEILYWNNGVYLYGAEEIISQECRVLEPEIKTHDISEIISIIQDKTGYHSLDEFDEDIYRVNVQNGYVNLKTGRLEDHHPKYLSRVQLPVTYSPGTIPAKFLRYLWSSHDDYHTVYMILEMMGMCLIRDNHLFEIAYMHTGAGSNGKSILLEILQAVLGSKNVANKPIHDLENQRFALSSLDGKLANICADIAPDELRSTGNIKKLISGDYMDGEKKYHDSYSFRNFAKLIFSANQIPEVFDSSDAFARRFVIVDWQKKFYGKDRQFYVQTISDDAEELSGIFNIMIAFARGLLSRKRIKFEKTVRDAKLAWIEKSDPVKNFVEQMCVLGVEHTIERQRLFTEFIRFCKSKQIHISTQQQFNQKLRNMGMDDTSKKVAGQTNKIWSGLTLRADIVKGGSSQLVL